MEDLYSILGLNKNATDAEIKSAYRQLAKKYHPDLYQGKSDAEKKSAEEKFKKISHAYEVLSNPEKKENYDRFGSEDGMGAGFGSGGFSQDFGGGFDDILSNLFGGMFGGGMGSRNSQRANARQDGADISVRLTLEFTEAAFGVEKDVTYNRTEQCNDCKGNGSLHGTSYKTCTRCGGSGYVTYVQNSPLGRMQSTRPCDKCRGTGKEITENCPTCGGKGFFRRQRTLHVKVPEGVDDGQMMSYSQEGEAGRNGGANGKLIIVLSVKDHPLFQRKGFDLYLEYPIPFTTAALGGKVKVPTLTGDVDFVIPSGTQTGDLLKIKNKGIKYLRKENYGDLYLSIVVETPVSLSRRQKQLLEEIKDDFDEDNFIKLKKFNKLKKQ